MLLFALGINKSVEGSDGKSGFIIVEGRVVSSYSFILGTNLTSKIAVVLVAVH